MEQGAFESLKATFARAPVLLMPDTDVPFQVETDASDFAVRAVLSQKAPDGDWRPVAFFSRSMQPAERNYNVHDKELLSVVRAFEVWRPYLEGNPFPVEVFSDHRNLEYFMTARDLSWRQARWSLFLNRFTFVIHHRPGRLSAGPDGLSRRPDHEVPRDARDNVQATVLGSEQVARRGVVVELGRCGQLEVVDKVAAVQAILADGDILERIRTATPSDPRLAPVLQMVEAPALVKARLREFIVDGGLVRFCSLVYIPDNEEVKRLILQLYHDSILAGYPGRANTLALVAQNYYWPRMSEFVRRYVDGCNMCQRIKPRCQKLYGPLQPLEVPDGPWQHISTDYVGPLLVLRGCDTIQVVCNKLTKRVHFLGACSMDNAAVMCDGFMAWVWCLHGTPKKIVSDRRPQFVARYTSRMWERLGFKPALSTAHHPQSDGQTERTNQELEVYLRAFIDYYQDDWMDWLPFAEFAYNNWVSAATGMSPFYAEYGYNPTFSVDPVNSQMVPKADACLDRLHEVQGELRGLLELAAARMKHFHNAWVDKAPDYVIGDHVFLECADLRSDCPSQKLNFKKFGPFPISQKISDTAYRLALPDGWLIHNVFHVSCLVPAQDDTILGCRQEPPPPMQMEMGDEVEIERILWERRTRGGVTEFLVRWKGYNESEDEWLKEYNMPHMLEAIQEFQANERAHGKYCRRKGRMQSSGAG